MNKEHNFFFVFTNVSVKYWGDFPIDGALCFQVQGSLAPMPCFAKILSFLITKINVIQKLTPKQLRKL